MKHRTLPPCVAGSLEVPEAYVNRCEQSATINNKMRKENYNHIITQYEFAFRFFRDGLLKPGAAQTM